MTQLWKSGSDGGIERLRNDMNSLGRDGIPFVWGISFDLDRYFLLDDPMDRTGVMWHVNGTGNCKDDPGHYSGDVSMSVRDRYDEGAYREMFHVVRKGLLRGDSFLTNLTVATPVECSCSLKEIFLKSRAPYRLLIGDEFVCFSPETFVKISGRRISTFPMKGTSPCTSDPDGRILLADYKELCEHQTIVDLMRNDLNIVADEVSVVRFRYLEQIHTVSGRINQTSSEISGILHLGSERNFGDILLPLLPAGSISGAPKEATVKIIHEAETVPRGWYTGVFGYFDGAVMDSAVMIRCIQRDPSGTLRFHSGGGVTVNSDPLAEYLEISDKIYLTRK